MTDVGRDRLARVALGRLAEPGDPRFAGLVAEMGAVELLDALIGQRDLRGVLADVTGRVDTLGPERELERAAGAGIRFVDMPDGDRALLRDYVASLAGATGARGH